MEFFEVGLSVDPLDPPPQVTALLEVGPLAIPDYDQVTKYFLFLDMDSLYS